MNQLRFPKSDYQMFKDNIQQEDGILTLSSPITICSIFAM